MFVPVAAAAAVTDDVLVGNIHCITCQLIINTDTDNNVNIFYYINFTVGSANHKHETVCINWLYCICFCIC